jgi:hypothetical protein
LALRHLVAYFDGHELKLLDGKKEEGEGLWPRRLGAINAQFERRRCLYDEPVACLDESLA